MAAPNFEFQRSLPFTEFVPNGSFLQRRDPASFLLAFLCFFSAVLISASWVTLGAAGAAVLLGLALSGIPLRSTLRALRKALPFVVLIALLNPVLNGLADSSPVLVRLGPLRLSEQDLGGSAFLFARFTLLLLAMNLATGVLSISRFIHGLEDLLSPLSLLGVPVHDLVVTVEIAIRYIPLLTLTAERIAKAQASRGATWGTGRGGLRATVRQVIPLVVPLFLHSFQKADKIAGAMDARGYGLVRQRSRYTTSRVGVWDIFLVATQVGLLILGGFLLAGR